MTRSALPKLRAYPALAAAGLLTAVVLGRPELVSLAVPFALFLAVGGSRLPVPDVTLALNLDRRRISEGDDAGLELETRSTTGVDRLELTPTLPERLHWSTERPAAFRLSAGESRSFTLPIHSTRFGAYQVGACEVRAFDNFGLVVDAHTVEPVLALRVYPGAERAEAVGRAPRDAALRRKPGGTREGRRNRVRRHPSVRTGRSRPPDQLAGERAPAGPPGEREPPGAQRRRGAVRRHLRGGADGRRGNAQPRGSGCSRARPRIPGAARPRRARRLRRQPSAGCSRPPGGSSCTASSSR